MSEATESGGYMRGTKRVMKRYVGEVTDSGGDMGGATEAGRDMKVE